MSRAEAELVQAALARAGLAGEEAPQALLDELWAQRRSDAQPWQVELPAAERLGELSVDAGEEPVAVVRRVLLIGRALVECATGGGVVDDAGAARLTAMVDEAAGRAAAARERIQIARRESWLSLLTHDIKGRLNIVTLNLWLLRQAADPKHEEKFHKIERAINRMLELLKDVRELHDRSREAPPNRSGHAPAGKP